MPTFGSMLNAEYAEWRTRSIAMVLGLQLEMISSPFTSGFRSLGKYPVSVEV